MSDGLTCNFFFSVKARKGSKLVISECGKSAHWVRDFKHGTMIFCDEHKHGMETEGHVKDGWEHVNE